MNPLLDDLDIRVDDRDLAINRLKSDVPQMTDFHMHTYYELSYIVSGDVKVLFSDRAFSSAEGCLFLTRPYTMHYVIPQPCSGYERINILFQQEYVTASLREWEPLMASFGKNGTFIPVGPEYGPVILPLCEQILAEKDLLSRKLLFMLLLNRVASLPGKSETAPAPQYLTDVLNYIVTHYDQHLVAQDLADRFCVSRTKLMCDFHAFTGYTLGAYITSVRLRNARRMMARERCSLGEVAEQCGFSSSSNMIRVFKKELGSTPTRLGQAGEAPRPKAKDTENEEVFSS